MGALDEFLSGGKQQSGGESFPTIHPDTQKKRDQDRVQILQQELVDAQNRLKKGDPRAQGDIDALNKELGFTSKVSVRQRTQAEQPAQPAQSGSALDSFLSGEAEPKQAKTAQPSKPAAEKPAQPASQPAQQPVEQPTEPVARTRAGTVVQNPNEVLTGALGALSRTVGGAARGAVTAGLGLPGEINKAIVENVGSLLPNAPALPTTAQIQKSLPLEPTSHEGKIAQKLGEFIPLPVGGKAVTAAPKAGAAMAEQFAAKKGVPVAQRIEPTMEGVASAERAAANQPAIAGVGAARANNEAILAEAKARATPQLKAELDKVKPNELNNEALNRIMEADQLPVPIQLTKGQATQHPNVLSDELNVLGTEQKVAERLNAQNAALHENVDLMKERVAPNINTTDYVHDAENIIDRVGLQIKADNDAITQAYKELENYGAGKLQVDSQTFANNAKNVLAEGDDAEFLPSVIANKLEAYANGKPMNFNQFENLRTQIAKETRKAQKADDGNAVHALALVRSQLEQMPLLNETAEAKVLADKARSLAKQQFDFLDKNRASYNPLYEKVFNGAADTKDLIQSLAIRGKNADFEKVLQLARTDPTTMEHLRSGVLDSIVRDATTQDGKFKAAVFAKKIRDLDVNKRLDALFGEDAKTLRSIANTGTLINARPAGSYVNEAKSGTVAVQMAKQLVAEQAKQIPGAKMLLGPAAKVIGERKVAKQVEQALKPGAGVRLSDIGK